MSDVLGEMDMIMQHLVAKYEEHGSNATTSVASAPDTTKFRATKSAMIEFAHNVHIHGGAYGIPKTYKYFVKIGSMVPQDIQKKMFESFAEQVKRIYKGMEVPGIIYCPDGSVTIGKEYGTNWGGFGIYSRPHSDYTQKKWDEANGPNVGEEE